MDKKRKKYSWRLLRRNNLSEICNSPGKTLKVIPGAAGCWPQFSPSDKTISHRVTESLGNRVSCTLLNVSFTCVPAVLWVLTKSRRYPLIRCLYEGGKFWKFWKFLEKKRKKNWKCWNFWKLLELLELFGNSTHPANPILFYLSIYSTQIYPLFCRLVLVICYKWIKKEKVQLEAFEKK